MPASSCAAVAFFFVSPRIAGLIAIVGIWVYAVLVRADTAVVRAAIMASMCITALLFLGRPTFLYASLFAAALFLTVVNPLMLWDAGFQLNFMAVLELMLYLGSWSGRISDKLEPRVGESRAQRLTHMIADVSLTTLATIVFTLPVFWRAVGPQIIVISVVKENKYDHPHPEILQRTDEIGAAVLRTDEMGTIKIISDGRS